mgnify:CR=1 FL=1
MKTKSLQEKILVCHICGVCYKGNVYKENTSFCWGNLAHFLNVIMPQEFMKRPKYFTVFTANI